MTEPNTQDFKKQFENQRSHKRAMRKTSPSYRLAKLRKIKELILDRKDEIAKAINQDFHKPNVETDLTELLPIITMINLLEKKLPEWMSEKKVGSPLLFKGSKSWIRKEGKGNCLILSPWNYPFQLTVYPVLTAFAAGNTCIVKPSEYTPNTNKIVIDLLAEVFSTDEVVVFEGDAKVSTELLRLPFDHIFFTGSTPVGKIVMKAASEHLASVALELGGKSPVFIERGYDLEKASKKIIWGKLVNGGQTCVAPDYILVHKNEQKQFVQKCKEQIENFYGKNFKDNDDYNYIITQRHAKRLNDLVVQAQGAGATLECGGEYDEQKRLLTPTILTDVSRDMEIMQDEIFGPVLPIITYETESEALEFINSYDNALAMYLFTDSARLTDKFMQETYNGGVTINDTLMAVGHPTLPFGGAGKSGIGKYHGEYGFEEFSNLRSVMRRDFDLGTSYFYPPYDNKKAGIVSSLLKKFSSFF
jgi:aldehyde dehydrogenase (NAD+)